MGCTKRVSCFAAAIAAGLLFSGVLSAAPAGSAYRTAIDALSPLHYYGMEESDPILGELYALPRMTPVTDSGTAAGTEARYIGVANATSYAGTGDVQGSGFGSKAIINATVGPNPMSKFTSPENANYLLQVAGFNPNLGDPTQTATQDALGFNRVFEGNGHGAIQLNAARDRNADTIADNVAQGFATPNGATNAFTWAGWIRLDNANTSSTVRIYDAGGNNDANGNFFQVTSGGTSGMLLGTSPTTGAQLTAFYPSGTAASSVGGDRGVGDSGQWYFLVVSYSGNTPAERAASLQLWERYADKTNALRQVNPNLGAGYAGVAKIGWRDQIGVDPSNNAAAGEDYRIGGLTQGMSDKVDEIGVWNRVLQYDERESLYVAATTPTGGAPANTTTTAGNWCVNGNWSAGHSPIEHGGNQLPYYAAVIDHDILATKFDLGAGGTDTFRSNVYSLTVNPGKTLTLDNGATVRSAADTTIAGNVVLGGAAGVFSTTPGAKDYNAAKAAKIDAGRDAVINGNVTLASPWNSIVAEEDVTIGAAATLTVLHDAAKVPAAGAHLKTVVLADYNAGSGSLIDAAGVLSGAFASVTLPAGGGDVGDALGRRYSVLTEGRAADGSGPVDAVKIGLAAPGDVDYNGTVDFNNLFTMAGNYGFAGPWTSRDGDTDNDTDVDVDDAFYSINNYGLVYASNFGTIGDGVVSLLYDELTGMLKLETPAGEQLKSLKISSTALLPMLTGNGAWIGQNTFATYNSASQQGFVSATALGNTFLMDNGDTIGLLLPAGLTQSQLLDNLTVEYGVEGRAGTFRGDVIPEPSTFILVGVALAGLALLGRRARK